MYVSTQSYEIQLNVFTKTIKAIHRELTITLTLQISNTTLKKNGITHY